MAVQWHLSTLQTSWVTGAAILGAFIGAFVFGRIADVIGRKKVYVTVAVIMIIGAIASALAPGFIFLVVARLVLGFGIGGDYPVSAVFMSEYSNRKDRGRLVGLVFSMQALGLIVGPLVALLLLSSGIGDSLTWRILLGLGAVPAAAVVYLRSRMPESPRYLAQVQGEHDRAAGELEHFSEGVIAEPTRTGPASKRMRLGAFLTDPHMLKLLLGTAGAVVSLRLRLLRQHPLPSRHLERGGRHGQLGDKAAVVTRDVRNLRSPRLPAGGQANGSYRPPSPAVHRVLGNGVVFRRARHRPPTHPAGGAVSGHPRAELLLHSVRAEHDDIRACPLRSSL